MEQGGLVEDVPAHGKELERDKLQGPSPPKPACDSVKHQTQVHVEHGHKHRKLLQTLSLLTWTAGS